MKILICDDDKVQLANWVEQVSLACEGLDVNVGSIGEEDVAAEIKPLLSRNSRLFDPDATNERLEKSKFDEGIDVLVLDYDLTFVDAENARHTGEELARLCRFHTDCKYIIVMNQTTRTADFDLTLSGRLKSYADLNIRDETIGEKGLWKYDGEASFRPSYWDDIVRLNGGRVRLTKELAKMDLGAVKLIDFLAMPEKAINALSDRAFEYICPAGNLDAFSETVFAHALRHTTESKEINSLVEKVPDQAARLLVHRLSKWLSREVLGPQDVLIDIPHLIERLPFTMDRDFGDPSDGSSWSSLRNAGIEAIAEPIRSECKFERSEDWLGRPSFWWPEIESHEWVLENRKTFDPTTIPDLVFAEDLSDFIPLEQAAEFRSNYENRFARRFLRLETGRKYEPIRRILEA